MNKDNGLTHDSNLTKVCQAMWHLNKLRCKNPCFNPMTKATIYRSLKRPFVRWLYEHGFCIGVTCESALKECRCCKGTGNDFVDNRTCRACNGGGVYCPPAFGDSLLGFHFIVNGITYKWHLPKKDVDFLVPKQRFAPVPTICDPERRFSEKEAMQVVRSFLDAAQWRKVS